MGEVPATLEPGSGQRVIWQVVGKLPDQEAVPGLGLKCPVQEFLPEAQASSHSGSCECDTEPEASGKNPGKEGEGGSPRGTVERGPVVDRRHNRVRRSQHTIREKKKNIST